MVKNFPSKLAAPLLLAWGLLGFHSAPSHAEQSEASATPLVEEYLSLTCPHCAAFHSQLYPFIKQDYIDTKKIRFAYRDFPLDKQALRAAALARCGGKRLRPKLLALMLDKQDVWMNARDPEDKLLDLVRLLGIGEARAKSCLEDRNLQRAVLEEQILGRKKHAISSTPSLVIAGRKFGGRMNERTIRKAIEKARKASARDATNP